MTSTPVQTVNQASQPTPALLFDVVWRYIDTAALKAAVDLDVFTAIAEGKHSVAELAQRCQASERGMRMLCDALVIIGFITKENDRYELTLDSATFLDRRSRAYMGTAAQTIGADVQQQAFSTLGAAVRKGGTVLGGDGSLVAENPFWVEFARNMAPMMRRPAQVVAGLLSAEAKGGAGTSAVAGRGTGGVGEGGKTPVRKILDVAGGHGVFGITLAQQNPGAVVTAVDWANVLEVAKENAQQGGVAERYRWLPGSAFDVDFGSDFDVVLLTNFMHHFDPTMCEALMHKVHKALVPEGRVVIVDFVPDETRVTPAQAAKFCLTMLVSTASGDVYTFSEYQRMLGNADFRAVTFHDIPGTPQQVVLGTK